MSLILLSVILIPLVNGANLNEGDRCSSSKYNGICKNVYKCPVIYDQLVAGRPLETLCSFSDQDPIVCCPINNLPSSGTFGASTTTPTPSFSMGPEDKVTAIPLSNQLPRTRSADKCWEYSRSVYALVTPPVLTSNPRPINTSLCALGPSPTLIVGGHKAKPKKFPHMAAIGYGNTDDIKWHCGGTLISDRFVLTAAHCLRSGQWGPAAWVRLGEQNLRRSDDGARPKNFRVLERIKHPNYKNPLNYNDIALLKLEKKVTFDAWIRPACLPYTSTDVDLAVATGWGRVEWAADEGSEELLEVTLKTVSNSRCNNYYSDDKDSLSRGIDPKLQICAGEVGKDTCQGDSGGPLAIFNKDHECMYDVIGVTSLGRICGSTVPGIYTRVSNYIPWIENIVWP